MRSIEQTTIRYYVAIAFVVASFAGAVAAAAVFVMRTMS